MANVKNTFWFSLHNICPDTSILNGISDIKPNTTILNIYFLMFLVCMKPSTTKNANIGNEILPKILKIIISGKNNMPIWSISIKEAANSFNTKLFILHLSQYRNRPWCHIKHSSYHTFHICLI